MMKISFGHTILLIFLLTGSLQVIFAADNYDFKYDQLYYRVTNESLKELSVVPQFDSYPLYELDNIPNGVVIIPDSLIYNEENYKVTGIASFAFPNNSRITSIEINSNITNIEMRAIDRPSDCHTVTVDEKNPAYKSVDDVLFSKDGEKLIYYPNAKTATHYTIPDGVKSLAYGAIGRNLFLTDLSFPNSLQTIAAYNICALPNLLIINNLENTQLNSNEGYSFDGISISSIIFPEGIEIFQSYFLSGCNNLTEVELPATTKKIAWYSFTGNPLLTTLRCKATMPPIIPEDDHVFEDTDIAAATLYVPQGSKAAYEAAYGWSDFGTICEDVAVGAETIEANLTFNIKTAQGRIIINLKNKHSIRIYNIAGVLMDSIADATGEVTISVKQGVYIVRINDQNLKVLVE